MGFIVYSVTLLQAVLSLYASGKTSGVVLDIGDGVSQVVPVYEGYTIPHAIQRADIGGRDVTTHLQRLLRRAGLPMQTGAEMEVCVKISRRAAVCNTRTMHHDHHGFVPLQSPQIILLSN